MLPIRPSDDVTLPQELIEEIFQVLPVKSLKRFKCLSKLWNGSISSPYFVKMHSQRAPLRTNMLTSTPEGLNLSGHESSSSSCLGNQVRLLDFPPNRESNGEKKKKKVLILGSDHGLVALARTTSIYHGKEEEFFLWNPLTGDYKQLPQHPYNGIILSGFGYDSYTDDYKVYVKKSNGIGSIYSVRRNSWRDIGSEFGSHRVGGVGCLVNGTLHWNWALSGGRKLVGLDLKSETYVHVPAPVPVFDNLNARTLPVVLDGKLCISFYAMEHDVSPTEIWVMKEYGVKESWTKLLIFREGMPLALYISNSNKQLLSVTLDMKKELIKYEYDDAKGKGKISERFKICNCDDDDGRLPYCNHSCQICQVLLCSESLYFPSAAMFGTSK